MVQGLRAWSSCRCISNAGPPGQACASSLGLFNLPPELFRREDSGRGLDVVLLVNTASGRGQGLLSFSGRILTPRLIPSRWARVSGLRHWRPHKASGPSGRGKGAEGDFSHLGNPSLWPAASRRLLCSVSGKADSHQGLRQRNWVTVWIWS